MEQHTTTQVRGSGCTSPPDEQKVKRKRNRLSLSCSYCKRRKIKCDKRRPSCTSCVRLHKNCVYETSYWHESTTNARTPSIPSSLLGKTKEELCQLVQKLQGDLQESQRQQSLHSTIPLLSTAPPSDPLHGVKVDLYEYYNTLTMKRSLHEDHKPLCTLAIHKKDSYLTFFTCYLYITMKANALFINGRKEKGQLVNQTRGESKWLHLIDTEREDSDLKAPMEKILSDRHEIFRSKSFPLMTVVDDAVENKEAILQQVQAALPERNVIEILLDFYFRYMWCARPYVDRTIFETDLSRIIVWDHLNKPVLKLSESSDFAILATFLILLRYAYTALHIIDQSKLESHYKLTSDIEVPVFLVSAAKTCLSFYYMTRTTTLPILQALMFLTEYIKDAPEAGEGVSQLETRNLFGIILQSALQMGLHRDPVNYPQIAKDIPLANIRRRIWHCIISMDAYTSIYAGTIPTIPDSSHVDVQFPMFVTVDPVEHTQRDLLIRGSFVDGIYLKVAKMVNNIKGKIDLDELVATVKQTRSLVDGNYALERMVQLDHLIPGTETYTARLLQNNQSLIYQLTQATFEVMLDHSLMLYFECNTTSNVELYKKFFADLLVGMGRIFDLCGAYFNGDFERYTCQVYRFEIFPRISAAIFKILSISFSCLLRAYHAQELLASTAYENKHGNTPQMYEEFAQTLTSICVYITNLMRQNLAPRYYLALEATAYFGFAYKCLATHRFKPMTTIINFMEPTDSHRSIITSVKPANRDVSKKTQQIDSSLLDVPSEWMSLPGSNKTDNTADESVVMSTQRGNGLLEYSSEELTRCVGRMVNFQWCEYLKLMFPSYGTGASRSLSSVDIHPYTQQHQQVLSFAFPTQEQLHYLRDSGRLRSLDDFSEFEFRAGDEVFFRDLYDTTNFNGRLPQNLNGQSEANNSGFM